MKNFRDITMNKLNTVISEALNIQINSINDDMNIENTYQWDSLSHINIITGIEDAYGVQFTGDEIAEMRSISAIKSILKEHCPA